MSKIALSSDIPSTTKAAVLLNKRDRRESRHKRRAPDHWARQMQIVMKRKRGFLLLNLWGFAQFSVLESSNTSSICFLTARNVSLHGSRTEVGHQRGKLSRKQPAGCCLDSFSLLGVWGVDEKASESCRHVLAASQSGLLSFQIYKCGCFYAFGEAQVRSVLYLLILISIIRSTIRLYD